MFTINNESKITYMASNSKFIAILMPIKNKNDAISKLKEISEKYWEASHRCYAYIVDDIKKFSDNKEPIDTAGKPILRALENNDLNYVLCVVIRYFGGTLLGKSGLIKAYNSSATSAIKQCDLIDVVKGYEINISFDLNMLSVINDYFRNVNIIKKNINLICNYTILLNLDEFNIYAKEFERFQITIVSKKNILIKKEA